jgi:glycosyltransferase involved in cell wall biosynthesis
MACGTALVVTDNGGSADYAFDGETALVVPPGNIPAIVAAVERLLTDHELKLRLSKDGHRFVQRFRWESAGDKLEQLLRSHVTEGR